MADEERKRVETFRERPSPSIHSFSFSVFALKRCYREVARFLGQNIKERLVLLRSDLAWKLGKWASLCVVPLKIVGWSAIIGGGHLV